MRTWDGYKKAHNQDVKIYRGVRKYENILDKCREI